MRKLFYILILIQITLIPVFAQSPLVTQRIYWPGMWNETESWGRFKLDPWPKDTFVVRWTVYNSDPAIGYPYRPGNAIGISDTAKVRIYFDNRSDADYPIASQSPETWFYPLLYDPNVDVFTSAPIADTSEFGFRFEHWITMMNDKITSKPDTIHCLSSLGEGSGMNYGIIFSVWGVPKGTYRVILKPTINLPTGIKLVLNSSDNYFRFSQGQNLIDTLNSYSVVASYALLRNEFTLFNTYVDSIFYLNSRSLPGWALRYHGYAAQADTINAIVALDSVLNVINNRLDPLIPDSSEMTEIYDAWLKQWNADYSWYRTIMLYPERGFPFPK